MRSVSARIVSAQRAAIKPPLDRAEIISDIMRAPREPEGDRIGRKELIGPVAEWDREVIRRALPVLRERMKTLTDARDQVEFLFAEPHPYEPKLLVPKKKEPPETLDVLVQSTVVLGHVDPFNSHAIRAAIEGIAAAVGWSLAEVSQPIRVAITGRTVGLPLFESLELLGRERALARIERAQDLLEKGVD